MSFFKKLSETVKDTASSIGSKSADLVETGKLMLQKNQLEGTIKDKKTAIGELVYLAHQQNSDPDMNALSEIFSEIKDLESQVAAVDEKLRKNAAPASAPATETPTAEGSVEYIFCTQCGQKLPSGAKFCNNCGEVQKSI